jgi:zinc transport system ATP-binding protein
VLSSNNVIVDIHNVSFSYGRVPVLDDVTLTIKAHDFLSIIGPNGGGKTTILKLILGFIEPNRGSILVFSQAPRHAREHIGYVPQQFSFDYDFPIQVLDVVLMGRLGSRGIGQSYNREDRDLCMHALKRVGMEAYHKRGIGNLSGGQRQRVLIARALATDPRLLLLDEPVSSVDTTWQQSFYELLSEVNKKSAIVMVTHDISVVSTYIDKIACLNKKLYYHGSKKEGLQTLSELYECPVQLISHVHQPSDKEPDNDS